MLFRRFVLVDMVVASDMLFEPSSHPTYTLSSMLQAPIIYALVVAYRSQGTDIETEMAPRP